MSDLSIHPAAARSIDQHAEAALSKVTVLALSAEVPKGGWAPTPAIVVTKANIRGDPEMWLNTENGPAWAFYWLDNDVHGIPAIDYIFVESLLGVLLKVKWVKASVGDQYVRHAFVDWARIRLAKEPAPPFAEFFTERCHRDITEQDVWAPVQGLHLQSDFQFGDVRFVILDEAYFNRLEAIGDAFPDPENTAKFKVLVGRMRNDMEERPAVHLKITAERGYAANAGQQVAEDAVGLLKFFSRAARTAGCMSPVALLGATVVPKTHIIVGDIDNSANYVSTNMGRDVDEWIVNIDDYNRLPGDELAAASRLIYAERLTPFGRDVRSSILAFSRAIGFADLADRLVFAMSAVEGLFLRNPSEPIQQNIGERMAFLLSDDTQQRIAIVGNLRDAYRIRSQYIHHRLSAGDTDLLDETFSNIRAALACALQNVAVFNSKDEFIEAIELRKFGG